MNRTISSYSLTIVGTALLAIGVYFIKTSEDPQGLLRTLPYICVGLGCAIFGHGMGELIDRRLMKNHPAAAKQLEIDKKDERNAESGKSESTRHDCIFVWSFNSSICLDGDR